MHIAHFPRIRVAHLPTPLEPLARLSAFLDGPEIWIKRDDCTGLSTGGNKARKLEFLMADAQAQGAQCVATHGATQSNHARQTAAFAAKLGIDCHLLLESRTGSTDPQYNSNGNVFLDHLHGATIETRGPTDDMNAALDVVVERLRKEGKRVYAIPGGGSNAIGALGYVNCALELLHQANDRGLRIDTLVHPTGSAGTQAGLVVGMKACNAGIPVLGIGVRAARARQEANVLSLARVTAETIGCPGVVRSEDVVANTDYIGNGYGLTTAGALEAIELFARLEGVLLDPVYTGKGAAGLIDLIRKGHFKRGQRVVFLHTGGATSLFGYTAAFGYGGKS